MQTIRAIALVLSLGIALAGCSTLKKFTGQRDDTVLPGQREDILPPDQQVARDPNIGGKSAGTADGAQPACDPKQPGCEPAVDQESTGADSQ